MNQSEAARAFGVSLSSCTQRYKIEPPNGHCVIDVEDYPASVVALVAIVSIHLLARSRAVPPTLPALNHVPCTVRHLRHSLPFAPCGRCGNKRARRVWEASRSAIDIDVDHPVLLLVSVHHCAGCSRYFRLQPPCLRPNAVYTERVRRKAVLSVYEDGMAIRRVKSRLARDFWVSPNQAMVRRWCHEYAEGVDFEGDFQGWVVEEFSGVLCVYPRSTRMNWHCCWRSIRRPRKAATASWATSWSTTGGSNTTTLRTSSRASSVRA
jgi:hypothetical protein